MSVTPSTSVNAHVLRIVLDERLLKEVREGLGASYVATLAISPSLLPRPTVYSRVYITVDAAYLEDAHATALSILEDLIANGPTAGELQQARAVAAADYDKVTNSSLLSVLTSRLYTSDDNILTSKRSTDELEEVTAATLQALAAELYDTENRIEVVRLPTDPTEESS